MIYWKLFLTFFKIGLFNFGGGYAMISFLQNEVVYKHAWLSTAEFTDIVAISQVTPGPVGINLATYLPWLCVCPVLYYCCWPENISLLRAPRIHLLGVPYA